MYSGRMVGCEEGSWVTWQRSGGERSTRGGTAGSSLARIAFAGLGLSNSSRSLQGPTSRLCYLLLDETTPAIDAVTTMYFDGSDSAPTQYLYIIF